MNYLRIFIVILILLLLSFVLHYVVFVRGYNQGYTYESISDSLFIVGVIGFFPAFMAQMGSYKLFYGFQYALRSFMSTDFRRKYANISDYLVDKKANTKTSLYYEFLISAGMLLIAAGILAMLWGREL